MINKENTDKIYKKILEMSSLPDEVVKESKLIFKIFSFVLEQITLTEGIHFPTLFTRLAFAGTKHNLSSRLLYQAHQFRRAVEQDQIEDSTLDLGIWVVCEFLAKFSELEIPLEIEQRLKSYDFDHMQSRPTREFKRILSGLIVDMDIASGVARFIDEEEGDIEHNVLFNLADRNEPFTENLKQAFKVFKGRFMVNLVDVEIDDEGHLLPKAFVIQPDYLMDVSSIAECFSYAGTEPIQYLLRKLLPTESSTHMILGNIANFLLDRLCDNIELEFEDLISSIFHLYPLSFARMDNEILRDLIARSKEHFVNLKRTIQEDFKAINIDCKDVYLEPSFYSRDYGLQGRLDVFHHSFDQSKADIIELKSGKTFRPNVYGINANHYIQTLLYDLIIRSVYKRSLKLNNYILYSSAAEKSLKFGPSVTGPQYDALRLRNTLIIMEFMVENASDPHTSVIRKISAAHLPDAKGYVMRDIVRIENALLHAEPIVLRYYEYFLAFVSREHHLAKIGEHGEDKNNGLASLWLESTEEKQERFAMLEALEIIENRAGEEACTITLRQNAAHRKLSSFRAGDIVVFYPKDKDRKDVLHHQIFKCNILSIDDTAVLIRLRSKQNNLSIFEQYQFWNLEPDFLDSSFNIMYRGLFQFLESPDVYQSKILTSSKPSEVRKPVTLPPYPISDEQRELLTQMLSTVDYYLLWGPPGTGKTSYLLKYASQYLREETDECILLLAYTNRAVDEICKSLESIKSVSKSGYIRIGSSHATDEAFQDRLLSTQIKTCNNRQQIRDLLDGTRVFVSTVSSIHSMQEVFDMKHFDTIIVDEASQIIEPMLVGLLYRADRFMLIGDHKQLPAVVVQESDKTRVEDVDLRSIGLVDLKDSLFERLYKRCVEQEWTHAYGIISHQGRMHEQLMAFPNKHFYQNALSVIPQVTRLTADFGLSEDKTLAHVLKSHRLIYIDTPADDEFDMKTNIYEALLVSELIEKLQGIYSSDDKKMEIGVITPYKAQIAQIQKQLETDEVIDESITIDTVERYQGSARDIIIISLCTNAARQVRRMSQLSIDGVDRKLNVALTRAREQIIIIGNKNLLIEKDIYKELISSYHQYEYRF